MKKLLLVSTFFTLNCLAQTDTVQQLANRIKLDTLFELNYWKLNRFQTKSVKVDKSKNDSLYLEKNEANLSVFGLSNTLANYLFVMERDNFNPTDLLPQTEQVLQSYTDTKKLVSLLKMIELSYFPDNSHNQITRKKLINAISLQMQIMAENTIPLYNYPTSVKQWFKGVHIETANDLFRPGLIQKNNDMDYTGALKIAVLTDLFKMDAFKPTQSYQMVSYGGEVYTPYFRDTNVFIKENSFNNFDRPHGNFQYLGLENHGIAENYRSRWSTDIRIGLIGSRFGYNFQYYLHRDISTSPYPTGWDAQIGYPGRLALQLNVVYECLILRKQADFENSKQRPEKFRIVPSTSAEIGVGHFMTFLQIGGKLSTMNFKNQNQLSILPRSMTQTKGGKVRNVIPFGEIDASIRYVAHNTMLSGFGVFESKEGKEGTYAEKSLYYLSKDRVNPFVIFINWRLGLQFKNYNFFYRYSFKSPEYKSAGFIYTTNGETLNPNKRWHQYANIGVSLTI